MPFRPGLDDDDELKALIALWRDGAADLDARIADVSRRILAAINRIPTDPNARNAVRRLRVQADRLAELENVASSIIDDATLGTQAFIDRAGFDRIYAAGAVGPSLPFSFTAPHRAAVQVLARDTFTDVLAMSDFVDDESRAFVRDVGRKLTGFKLTSGTPVKTQARALEREIRSDFRRRGIGAVRYRDGSRHSFGEYAEVLLRTKTGNAYNVGTLNQGRALGIRFYELLDGLECGLTEHTDPVKANGRIVPFEVAMAFPLAHPNCRRSINPRPDATKSNLQSLESIQLPAAREDQRQFERGLRAQQAQRRTGRRQRRARRPRQTDRAAQGAATPRRAPGPSLEALQRRARVQRLKAENVAQRQQAALEQARQAAGGGKVDPALLERWGVNEEQLLQARTVSRQVRADIREVAKAEADNLGNWLLDNDLNQLSRPERLKRKTEIVSGRSRFVREQSGYDFLETLDGPELARVRRRMADTNLHTPDLIGEQVRRKTNLDLTDDEAMNWVVDRWLHEDGLRSLASGRIPKYADPDNLIPGEYALDGYDITKLFGVDADDAAGHVAAVQAQAAEQYAARTLGTPRVGQAPWEMDFGDWLRELEQVEDILGSTQVQAGIDPGPAYAYARARIRELAPVDIDEGGAMNPAELFESIRSVAITAGLL